MHQPSTFSRNIEIINSMVPGMFQVPGMYCLYYGYRSLCSATTGYTTPRLCQNNKSTLSLLLCGLGRRKAPPPFCHKMKGTPPQTGLFFPRLLHSANNDLQLLCMDVVQGLVARPWQVTAVHSVAVEVNAINVSSPAKGAISSTE